MESLPVIIETFAYLPATICQMWFAAVFGAPFEQELEITPFRFCYRSRFDGSSR